MRERVGLTECSNYAKYRLSGDGAAEWLQGLFTNRLSQVGRIAPTPMLNPEGRIVGEFSIARVDDDDFFLFGSQAAEVHHCGSSPTCRSARRSASTCSGSTRRAVDRRAAPARSAVGDGQPGDSRLRSCRSAASTSG